MDMNQREWRQTFWPIIGVMALVIGLRVLALDHMEYKDDERLVNQLLTQLDWSSFHPLAFRSGNSGISHSSGAFYWLHSISFFTHLPTIQVLMVALFNALPIALGCALFWRKPEWRWALILMGTNAILVFASRKLWVPDLVPAWIISSMLCSGLAISTQGKWRMVWWGIAAANAVLTAHMYLAAAPLVVSIGLAFILCLKGRDRTSWLMGSMIAAATYVPYTWALIFNPADVISSGAPSSFSPVSFFVKGIQLFLLLGSVFPLVKHYFETSRAIHFVLLNVPLWALIPFLMAAAYSIGIWIFLLGHACRALIRDRGIIRRDPWLLSTLFAMVIVPVAMLVMRVGVHIHYAFGCVPLVIYSVIILTPQCLRYWKHLAWASAFVVVGILILITVHGGLPGEYGPGYRTQTIETTLRSAP